MFKLSSSATAKHIHTIHTWFISSFALAMLLSSSLAHGYGVVPKEHKFDNGLTLVTARISHAPIIRFKVQFDAGAKTETKETDGLTHLLEHLFLRGNGLVADELAFKKRARQLGILSNATTGIDFVDYYFTFPSVLLDEVVHLGSAVSRSLKVDAQEISEEISVVIDEFNRSILQPGFKRWNGVIRHMYGDKLHAYSPLGVTKKYILEANKNILENLRDRIMAPAGATIIMVGDVHHDEAIKVVDKYFGDWKADANWHPLAEETLPPFPNKSQRLNFSHPRQTEASAWIMYKAFDDKQRPQDSHTANVLYNLTQHKGTKFYQKYIKSGEFYDAGTYYSSGFGPTLYSYVAASAEKIDKAIDSMRNETKEWAQLGYFTQSQLDDVKRSISVGFKLRSDNLFDYEEVLSDTIAFQGLDYFVNYLDNLQSVTLEDVAKYAKTYLMDQLHVTAVNYNAEKAKQLKVDLNGDKYYDEHIRSQIEYKAAKK